MCQEEASTFALNKEIKQVILSKEAIEGTDASVKDGNMSWRLEN